MEPLCLGNVFRIVKDIKKYKNHCIKGCCEENILVVTKCPLYGIYKNVPLQRRKLAITAFNRVIEHIVGVNNLTFVYFLMRCSKKYTSPVYYFCQKYLILFIWESFFFIWEVCYKSIIDLSLMRKQTNPECRS